ncbi:hypothetical protein [Brucella intermedia]|uniref:hypothetical protein n=1 Tax=Brucella intermedia TaxID=94625 RepID=UPI00124F5B61|nr:hypothetical protein [Brucella intermedia]KAB2730364.1 hypothetical protein F9L02_09795 [Brucella intermedia]
MVIEPFGHWIDRVAFNSPHTWEDERRKHGQYLAARVVCALDPFVEKCPNVTADNGEPDGQQEGGYVFSVQSPDLLLPDDVDWKSIPHDLMYRILSIQNQIDY